MANIANVNSNTLQTDEEKKAAEAAAAAGGTPPSPAAQPVTMSSGQASTIQASPVAGASPQATPAQKTAQQGSGRFLNIQKYIKANEGVDYAGKIGEKFQKQTGQLQSGIAKSAEQTGAVIADEQARLAKAEQDVQAALADPTKTTEEQFGTFAGLSGGNYLQDIGVAGEAGLQAQQQAIAEKAGLVGTEGGRFQLLKGMFGGQGRQDYGKGQSKLDQLLLQTQSGQLTALGQQAGTAAKTAEEALGQIRATTATGQQDILTKGLAAQELAKAKSAEAVSGMQVGLEQRRVAEEQRRAKDIQEIQAAVSSGQITAEMGKRLGLEEGMALGDISAKDMAKLVSGTGTVGIGQVTNEKDIARANALARLSGNQEFANYAAMGDQSAEYATFNKEGFKNLASDRLAKFETAMNKGTFEDREGNPISANQQLKLAQDSMANAQTARKATADAEKSIKTLEKTLRDGAGDENTSESLTQARLQLKNAQDSIGTYSTQAKKDLERVNYVRKQFGMGETSFDSKGKLVTGKGKTLQYTVPKEISGIKLLVPGSSR